MVSITFNTLNSSVKIVKAILKANSKKKVSFAVIDKSNSGFDISHQGKSRYLLFCELKMEMEK